MSEFRGDDLKRRQRAAAEVERYMITFLLQYGPARELRVCDIQQIAASARTYAFDQHAPDFFNLPLTS